MWKQKIGISIAKKYDIPMAEVVKMLKTIGFDAISPEWENDKSLEEIVIAAKENNMVVQSLHAPFMNASKLWNMDENVSTPAKAEIIEAIEACAKYEIPILVMHTWIGFDYKFDANLLCFNVFDEIVVAAQKDGVKIAFENTEGQEFLFALMNRYNDNKKVGFCWDSGHEMCYNYSNDLLEKYGNRLIMTHLNDNLGISDFDGNIIWTDDLHLLPFDGIADWDYNVERLKKANKLEILNFELNRGSKPDRHENDIYKQMSLELYFTEAYKRACKIAYKYAY